MARTESIRVRVTEAEGAIIERVGRVMKPNYSDVVKPDGDVNVSSVLRHLLHEEADRRGWRNV